MPLRADGADRSGTGRPVATGEAARGTAGDGSSSTCPDRGAVCSLLLRSRVSSAVGAIDRRAGAAAGCADRLSVENGSICCMRKPPTEKSIAVARWDSQPAGIPRVASGIGDGSAGACTTGVAASSERARSRTSRCPLGSVARFLSSAFCTSREERSIRCRSRSVAVRMMNSCSSAAVISNARYRSTSISCSPRVTSVSPLVMIRSCRVNGGVHPRQ